jgi:hypothetical protein
MREFPSKEYAILKIHSHPNGCEAFSPTDDESDNVLFNSIFCWTEGKHPHASAIMLPDPEGTIFGRAIFPDGTFQPLDSILIPGDDLRFWTHSNCRSPGFAQRHVQLFGEGPIRRLQEMAIAVVGCSGTGSPVIEQLARLGVGRLVIVDPDKVEEKNLNRILNSTREDASFQRLKVDVLKRAIDAMGLSTEVETFAQDIRNPEALKAVAECDVIFGCVDSIDGRHLLNRLATFYSIPYFDLGVRLDSDGNGGISEAYGVVNYLKPDGSTLMDRKLYSEEKLRSAGLRLTDPLAYREQIKKGYIGGTDEDRPAVISINMQVASTAVNEFLARLHPYRTYNNADSSSVRISFVHGAVRLEPESNHSGMFSQYIGRGDFRPLLNMPALSEETGT